MINDNKLNNKEVLKFITAGNALFTVRNEITKNTFTYKVRYSKIKDKQLWFVSVLTQQDNMNNNSYSFIGTLRLYDNFPTYKHSSKSKISKEAQSNKVFDWFIKYINFLPEHISVYHSCKCGRCGKTLTVIESIQSGYGPECINFVHKD